MFNQQEINSYKQVKAPDELYQKVLSSCNKPNKVNYITKISALAACFILVMGLALSGLMGFGEAEVYVNGSKVTNNSYISLSLPKTDSRIRTVAIPQIEVNVKVNFKDRGTVKVSEGSVGNGTEKEINGEEEIVWVVPMIESNDYYMSITPKGKETIYLKLCYDEKESIWKVVKQNNKN
jgi:hypothetical protein